MRLIKKSEPKPLRITHVSENDLRNKDAAETNHNWVMAGQRTSAGLTAKGYDHRYVFSKATGYWDGNVFNQTLADTYVWLWRAGEVGQVEERDLLLARRDIVKKRGFFCRSSSLSFSRKYASPGKCVSGGKVCVESDQFIVMAFDTSTNAPRCEATHCIRQSDLIFPPKDYIIVFDEAVVVVTDGVWRINIDKIPFSRSVDHRG